MPGSETLPSSPVRLWHPMLEATFSALNTNGIRWCLLRWPTCPSAPRGDVDLLIERADRERMRVALRTLGLVLVPSVRSRSGEVYLAYHAPTDCWIRLHVVTELSFGPDYRLQTGAESACLARRVRDGLVFGLTLEDEFWTTLLHCLLDKGDVAPRHRERLRELADKIEPGGPLGAVVERVCTSDWQPERLVAYVREEAWDKLIRLAPVLAANWRRRTRLGRWLRGAIDLPVRLRNRWRNRGLSVAVLGPDGAGKSTLAAGLAQSFFCPARIIYMGFGISGGTGRQTLLTRFCLPGVGAPGRLLVLWWRVFVARYHQFRGRLVIFDRYGYDGLAPPPGRRSFWRRLSSWIKARACPAPDCVILLDVPGEVMYQRKGELDPQTLEFQRQRFLSLRQRLPCVLVLDATHPPAVVRVEATQRLWQVYATRWSHVSHAPNMPAMERDRN